MMATPAPEMPPWKLRQINEAQAKVQDLNVKLEEANRQMRIFRSENMVLLGANLCYRCSEITAREGLDRQWRELVIHRDQLVQQLNAALAEFAEAKPITQITGGSHAR